MIFQEMILCEEGFLVYAEKKFNKFISCSRENGGLYRSAVPEEYNVIEKIEELDFLKGKNFNYKFQDGNLEMIFDEAKIIFEYKNNILSVCLGSQFLKSIKLTNTLSEWNNKFPGPYEQCYIYGVESNPLSDLDYVYYDHMILLTLPPMIKINYQISRKGDVMEIAKERNLKFQIIT